VNFSIPFEIARAQYYGTRPYNVSREKTEKKRERFITYRNFVDDDNNNNNNNRRGSLVDHRKANNLVSGKSKTSCLLVARTDVPLVPVCVCVCVLEGSRLSCLADRNITDADVRPPPAGTCGTYLYVIRRKRRKKNYSWTIIFVRERVGGDPFVWPKVSVGYVASWRGTVVVILHDV